MCAFKSCDIWNKQSIWECYVHIVEDLGYWEFISNNDAGEEQIRKMPVNCSEYLEWGENNQTAIS